MSFPFHHMGIPQVILPPARRCPARAMFRTAVMMAASLALTGAVVAHAYYLKHQFYPTVVYLTKSSPSMAVSGGLREGGTPGREGRRTLLETEAGLEVRGAKQPAAVGTLNKL